MTRASGNLPVLLIALCLTLSTVQPAPAVAQSGEKPSARITLKDGRVLEGTIDREKDGYIWLNIGLGTRLFAPSDYRSIEREGGEADSAPVNSLAGTTYRDRLEPKAPGVYRAAVLTMEQTVGTHMTVTPIQDAIDELKADGVDIVVLKVNSGGGLGIEVEKMSNVIHNEYKKEFLTVGWIDQAISAAAMTAYTLDDIYFMSRGSFGAATGYTPNNMQVISGRPLEESLYLMERIAERGGHSKELFRAMQILDTPISYDKDPSTGEVTIYNDLSGEFVVNDGTDITALNSRQAAHMGLSAGTADTTDELEKLIIEQNPELNIKDIVWIGDEEPGSLFPVTRAEQIQRDWREEADFIEKRLGELLIKYNQALANAQRVGSFVSQAEGYLSQLERLAKRHVNLAFQRNLTEEYFDQQREVLAELRRRG